MWGKIGLGSGAAVKGIAERVRDDANRVGRKRLTQYILAEKGSEETGTEGLILRFFRVSKGENPQHPVARQKDSRFFYVFLPLWAVVPGGKR